MREGCPVLVKLSQNIYVPMSYKLDQFFLHHVVLAFECLLQVQYVFFYRIILYAFS